MLISYTAAYFSSLYKCSSSFVRSAAVIVIASAGHDKAHKPQAVQRSRPSSSRFKECKPRKFFAYGRCSSGYFTVGIFLKKCRIVIPSPFAIAGKYIRSQKFMGFCSKTFFLFDKDCITSKNKYPLQASPPRSAPYSLSPRELKSANPNSSTGRNESAAKSNAPT